MNNLNNGDNGVNIHGCLLAFVLIETERNVKVNIGNGKYFYFSCIFGLKIPNKNNF